MRGGGRGEAGGGVRGPRPVPLRGRVGRHGAVPGLRVVDEFVDEAPVAVEGSGHGAGLEGVLAQVPVEQQSAVEFGDLGVQQNLGALGDDVHGAAEALLHRAGEQRAQPDRAGVDDRREHRGAAVAPGQVAQDLDAAVAAVVDRAVQVALDGAGPLGEGGAGGGVDAEQHRAAEVADEAVHVGVERRPVEQGQVEREAGRGAPHAQYLGEGGGQRRRGGDARGARPAFEEPGALRGEAVVQAGGAGQRGAGGGRELGAGDGGQLGGRRYLVQPPLPPGAGALARPGVEAGAVGQVAREVVVRFGELLPLVSGAQVVHEHAQAERVGRDHVQVDVEPGGAVRQQGERHVQDLAGGDVHPAVGGLLPDPVQFPLGLGRGQSGEVVHGRGGAVARGLHALAAVVVEAGPEHGVAPYDAAQRRGEPAGVDPVPVELGVEVRGDAAERLVVPAADPVGVLHGGHREGVPLLRGRGLGPLPGARAGAALGEQRAPGGRGGVGGQLLEGDVVAALPPGAEEADQPQRVEAVLEQVVGVGESAGAEHLLHPAAHRFDSGPRVVRHDDPALLRSVSP